MPGWSVTGETLTFEIKSRKSSTDSQCCCQGTEEVKKLLYWNWKGHQAILKSDAQKLWNPDLPKHKVHLKVCTIESR